MVVRQLCQHGVEHGGGGRDVVREPGGGGIGREASEGTERLCQPLDGGIGEGGPHGGSLRTASAVVVEQGAAIGFVEHDVGVAEQRGQVIGCRPQSYALEINQYRPPAVEQDVARLEIAVNRDLTLPLEYRRAGVQQVQQRFCDLHVQGVGEKMRDKKLVFPAVERG